MGARQTGKSSYLHSHYPEAIFYDLLDSRERLRLSQAPELLNEVHWLIENTHTQFVLCSSSARKLKTRSSNLLGGRAWQYHFYPLVFPEIPEFDLLRALQQGLLPKYYLSEPRYTRGNLQAYVDGYLIDEIRNEGLVRNLQGFSRFLEVAGLCNAEMINASNIARDCGINRATVKEYYQILIDTLLGYFIYPYRKKITRDIVMATPKFYLFDVGVANYLAKNSIQALQGMVAGKSFEHYIFLELTAYRGLNRKAFEISYWRTKTGLEVDFILGSADVALEVKISEQVHQADLKGLIAFCEEHHPRLAIVVSQDAKPRRLEITNDLVIQIWPWRYFLQQLWQGKLEMV